MNVSKEWFGEWFNSPYYHILYKHRDFEEAAVFIESLIHHLNLTFEDKIMDLACGKGRHAILLNQKGFKVTGLDLSLQNIDYARQFENERLKFFVHDMRKLFQPAEFNYILNLFTSFGYFDTREENQAVIKSAAEGLQPGGKLIIDFLNPYTVIHNLVPCEIKIIDNIEFRIERQYAEGFIIKDIQFDAAFRKHHYQEKVKAIRRTEFLEYFNEAGFKVVNIFGDYNLEDYQAEKSERMIFICQK